MTIEERRRKAFEAHMESVTPGAVAWHERDENGYLAESIQAKWKLWNAALDSVVIELPDVRSAADIAYFNAEVIDAIETATLKVSQ